MRAKDLRSLMEAEVMHYSIYINSPHQDKDWFQYFCVETNDYLFFNVFLFAHSQGNGVRLNDFDYGKSLGAKKKLGMESIRKKLQEGVEKKIIHRHLCEEDARTKVYFINDNILDEIGDFLVHCQKARMNNVLDCFEEVFSLGITKSFHGLFAERYGAEIATQITRTVTSAAPKHDIFKESSKDRGKLLQVK